MPETETVAPSSPLGAKQLYAKYCASVLAVITEDQEGDPHIGSAFHVGDGFFVTARHVVEDQKSCAVEIDNYRLRNIWERDKTLLDLGDGALLPFTPHLHPDPSKDVAVFSVPALSGLPAIPLGTHLDDWIGDELTLSEVLVLGFPPIPLSRSNILVAARGQVNAVVDLINVEHVHFIVSATARGGFSGGVVLTEWGFALGVITSSLLKNGVPEELGYLTVLAVEPIIQCLADHEMMPKEVAETWDGLFTAVHLHYGKAEKGWAHSWIETYRDGWRAVVTYNTPDPDVLAAMHAAVENIGGFGRRDPTGKETRWEFAGVYPESLAPTDTAREALAKVLEAQGYELVRRPGVIDQRLTEPELPALAFKSSDIEM